MRRCALTLWLMGLAWLLGVGVAVTCADMPEQIGRVLGAIAAARRAGREMVDDGFAFSFKVYPVKAAKAGSEATK